VSVRRGEHERARAVLQRLVGVGACFEQRARSLDRAGAHGEQERAEVAGRRARVARGPGREQRADGRRIVLVRGPHQRGLAFPAFLVVDARAVPEQRVERRRVARARGRHQRRLALGRCGVRVGAALEEKRCHRGVAVLGRQRQRLHAVAVACVDLRAGVEECLGELRVAVVHGPVQRRRAVGVGIVGIGALREQGARRGAVAGLERAREVAGRRGARVRGAERGDEAA
jgi:hypothetical protein